MPRIVWDRIGERVYESGLDQGVLFLPDGSAVPWNGLSSIVEHFDKNTSSVYYDGMKIQDMVTLGDFSATMKAVTYPDEFTELEGLGKFRRGMFLGDQPPKTFGLCYRQLIGNDLNLDEAAFKLHLLYNVTAIPTDKTYASISDQPSLVEFEWNLTAVPEEISGFRSTAHFVWDSRELDPFLIEDLQAMFYGTETTDPVLLSLDDLITFIRDWYRVKIVDNGDGTWTATANRSGFINNLTDTEFKLIGVNAIYLDDVTFQISDTLDIVDVPQIKLNVNPDGTWTATTENPDLIHMIDATTFEIFNANAIFTGPEVYRITDTTGTD